MCIKSCMFLVQPLRKSREILLRAETLYFCNTRLCLWKVWQVSKCSWKFVWSCVCLCVGGGWLAFRVWGLSLSSHPVLRLCLSLLYGGFVVVHSVGVFFLLKTFRILFFHWNLQDSIYLQNLVKFSFFVESVSGFSDHIGILNPYHDFKSTSEFFCFSVTFTDST